MLSFNTARVSISRVNCSLSSVLRLPVCLYYSSVSTGLPILSSPSIWACKVLMIQHHSILAFIWSKICNCNYKLSISMGLLLHRKAFLPKVLAVWCGSLRGANVAEAWVSWNLWNTWEKNSIANLIQSTIATVHTGMTPSGWKIYVSV